MRVSSKVRRIGAVALIGGAVIGLGASGPLGVADATRAPRGTGLPPAPGTMVIECFEILRGPDPRVIVTTRTDNFGNDTLLVRRAVRMCEPALKLTRDTNLGNGTVRVLPNVTMTLGNGGQPDLVPLDGSLGLLRLPPSPPTGGQVLGASLQGHSGIGDSFFDVFVELPVMGQWQLDSFFDITYRIDFDGGGGTQTDETFMHLESMGGGTYHGQLDPPLQVNGVWLTEATLRLGDQANPFEPAVTRAMECFQVQRGGDPDDPYTLVTNNFGADKVLVRQAVHLCEGAVKSKLQNPAGAGVVVQPPNLVWECYRLQEGDSPNKAFRLFTNNFGETPAVVRRAVELCEDALKIRVDAAGNVTEVGHPSGRVYECYRIEAKALGGQFWFTTKNFGTHQVRTRHPNLMCEAAKKQLIQDFPPFTATTPNQPTS